jgi:sulfotransferase
VVVRNIMVGGLPRSGSTLLVNLLAQHPDVHIVQSSALLEVLYVLRNHWFEWIEHRACDPKLVTQRLRTTFSAICEDYDPLPEGKTVRVHKSRGWIAYPELLKFADPDAKLLVPVRNIDEILASWELLRRKRLKQGQSDGLPPHIASSQQARIDYWMRPDVEPIGLAVARLRDLELRGDVPHIKVPFEALTSDPASIMFSLWSRCGLDPCDHDFENVEQVTVEDDTVHGQDLHTIRKTVQPIPNRAKLVLTGE